MKSNFKKQRLEKKGTLISEETRMKIFDRCKSRCEYCGKKAVDIHHIQSRGQGGSNDINNLIALCRKCHNDVSVLKKISENKYLYIGRYKW